VARVTSWQPAQYLLHVDTLQRRHDTAEASQDESVFSDTEISPHSHFYLFISQHRTQTSFHTTNSPTTSVTEMPRPPHPRSSFSFSFLSSCLSFGRYYPCAVQTCSRSVRCNVETRCSGGLLCKRHDREVKRAVGVVVNEWVRVQSGRGLLVVLDEVDEWRKGR
jgi:hypothetical protein